MILSRYAFIGLLILVAIGFAAAPLVLTRFIGPRKRSRTKSETYECGMTTTGETWVRFRVQYFLYAILFVVFDVETVFLVPWAIGYGGLGSFALAEMAAFLGMLSVGLGYAWSRGALKWA